MAWINVAFWCPQTQAEVPVLDAATIRDQAIRLLPEVAARSTSSATLVNIQTILWADTAARRDLGAVTVLGRRVWITVGFARADWDFGDGSTETADTPGAAYGSAGPCETKQCPGYYGHTYRSRGRVRITLAVSWAASYSLDGTRFQSVGGAPITGPAASLDVLVKQARVVLVPNPDDN